MPASAADSPRRFHFGPYESDVRAGELRKNGLAIKLQKQPLQILKVLLERPGEDFASDYKGGRFDLWKIPWKGGSPVPVTHDGGMYGTESIDGRFLYYSKLEAPGVWKRSLNENQETRILDKSGGIHHWYDWTLVHNGIYFLNSATKPKGAIEFLNFESGKTHRSSLLISR